MMMTKNILTKVIQISPLFWQKPIGHIFYAVYSGQLSSPMLEAFHMQLLNKLLKFIRKLTGGTSNRQISAPLRHKNFGFHAWKCRIGDTLSCVQVM
jgi:hypothetical protein